MALDSTGDYYGENIAQGAVIGALGGALLGALAGGNARSAAIGAAAGAAVGAAGGYWSALQQQQQDQARLRQTILNDVQSANAQIDKTQLAFDQLVGCRHQQADRVRGDLTAGGITRTQAEQAMAGIRAKFQEDTNIARRMEANIQQRSADFEFANEQLNPQPYLAVQAAPLYVQTSQGAQLVGQINPGQSFQGARANDQFVRLTLADGRPAFVPINAVALQSPVPAAPQQAQRSAGATQGSSSAPQHRLPQSAAAPAPEVQAIVSTNLAKRAAFSDSIETADRQSNAFELGPSS